MLQESAASTYTKTQLEITTLQIYTAGIGTHVKSVKVTSTLLRPYYIAKRTRKMLISNIHLLSPQKWSQFVHFNIEKLFPRGQP